MRLKGPVVLTISAILFAVMAVLVRIAGYQNIPGSETTLVRFSFGFVTVVTMHFLGLTRIKIRRRHLLAARSVSGGLAILFYFLSLSATKGPQGTTLTNSVLLSNSYFIFAPIFGALFIREKLRPAMLAAIVIAFAGIYLVVSPKLGGIRLGDVYGLLSGILGGLAIVAVRELRRTEPATVVFLALCTFGTVIAAASLALEKPVSPSAAGWAILAAIAVTSTVGQLMQTYSFRYMRAGEGSLIAMTTVVYSSLAGILLFHERFTPTFAVGAALVLLSAGYLALTYNVEGVEAVMGHGHADGPG